MIELLENSRLWLSEKLTNFSLLFRAIRECYLNDDEFRSELIGLLKKEEKGDFSSNISKHAKTPTGAVDSD